MCTLGSSGMHAKISIQTKVLLDQRKEGKWMLLQPVQMMFGVSSIVPNTNIDGNHLHDCVK